MIYLCAITLILNATTLLRSDRPQGDEMVFILFLSFFLFLLLFFFGLAKLVGGSPVERIA